MLPRLQKSEYRGDYRIWLHFADGVQGEIDLESELWGEMFEPLKDKSLFADVTVDAELQTLVWPNGADLAPEFLYKKLRPGYELKPESRTGAA